MSDDARRRVLAAGLEATRERIGRAEQAAGRTAGSARLMVVTKYFPAADLATLVQLGVAEFGENREPEAGRKVAQVRAELPGAAFTMDMIGSVQRKKARTIARWARRVQSVDSVELAEALAAAAARARDEGERDDRLGVLLQISLDGDPARGGVVAADLPALADQIAGHEQTLRLDGLMVIAPVCGEAREHLSRTAQIAERFRRAHPEAIELSAGMSGDLETAVEFGSTCVRVGTAIMGPRPITSA